MKHIKYFEAIEIVKERKNKKSVKPHYILEYNYMIGDANGNTTEEAKISIDNPYLERYVKLLNSLKPTKGTWGLMLDSETILKCKNEKQISEDDYEFLMGIMFPEYDDIETDPIKIRERNANEKYFTELEDGIRSDTEYSFLVFQGVSLYYVDETNKRHETRIT